jgi:hypothetical protein
MNEESLLAAALEKHDVAERQAFLNEMCGGDGGKGYPATGRPPHLRTNRTSANLRRPH